jgi:putative PEP-CTERM system TPR-repeat lipoprotein
MYTKKGAGRSMKLILKFATYAGFLLLLVACQGQSKEEMVRKGEQLSNTGNPLGAIVYFRNALEKDPNYTEARYQLGLAYLKTGKLDQAQKELRKVQLLDPGKHVVLLDLASIALVNKAYKEAEGYINSYISENGKNSRSQQYLGLIRQAEGNLSDAEGLFRESIDLGADNADVRLALARLYIIQGRNDSARDVLTKSLAVFSENKNIYQMLATVEARSGNRDAALDAYENVIRLDPNSVEAYYFAGMLSLDGGDVDKAKHYANELQRRFPEHPAGIRLTGILKYVEGDYENAAIALRKSLKDMPDLSGYYFLGLTEFHLKNFELALNQFQQALDLNPDHLQSRVLLGMTLLQQKRIEDSIYQLSQVLFANDQLAIAHSAIGTAYLAKGEYDSAQKHFDRAIALDPKLADPHLKKGLLNLSQSNATVAELELEKALEVAPESLNTRFLLASLYLKQQNYQGVIELLEPALDGSERDAVLYNYMAAAYLAQKNTPKGIEALQKAKAAKNDYLAPYFNLANAYLLQKKTDLAEQEYKSLLEIAPDNTRALVALASLQELSGNLDEAEKSYQQARATNEPQGFLALAGYYARNKNYKEYATVVEEAYIAHPRHPQILNLRGRLMLGQKNFAEAIKTFKLLESVEPSKGGVMLAATWLANNQQDKAIDYAQGRIEDDSEDPAGYLLLAAIQQQLGKKKEAEQTLLRGISRTKDTRPLIQRLGGLYVADKRIQDAEKLFRDLHRDSPEYTPATFALAMLLDQRGYKQEAQGLYREILDKSDNHTGAMNNLAYLYAENNAALEDALLLAVRAFRNEPSNPVILDTLGFVLIKHERFKEAVDILNKASELLPDMPTVRVHQAQALIGVGDTEAARRVLKHVVDLNIEPDSSRAHELLNGLNSEKSEPRG